MAQVRLLYKTDHRHSFDSRDLIGVFTSKAEFEKATSKIIIKEIKKDEDFENDKNALITYLNNYGEFNQLEVKSLIDYKPKVDDKYIIIEKERINLAKIQENFPDKIFIDNHKLEYANHYLIIS